MSDQDPTHWLKRDMWAPASEKENIGEKGEAQKRHRGERRTGRKKNEERGERKG